MTNAVVSRCCDARRVASAEAACGVPGREDVDALVDSFRPELMELCHAWAKGARFVDLNVQ